MDFFCRFGRTAALFNFVHRRKQGMKRFMKTSFLSLVLAVCLIAGMISPMQTQAAEKAKTKRAIAIVFDNSGSMYDGEKAWCRAIYAMEVFAAMMNEGDTLQIYPMWPIEVNGSYYEKDGKPLTISSRSDVAKIRDIFTPDAIPGYSKPIGTGTPSRGKGSRAAW